MSKSSHEGSGTLTTDPVGRPADLSAIPAVPRCRPQRADARRNYEAILAAASDAFAAEGSDAALDEIARRAGVGIGTLYRHFPARQDLLEAVFLDRVDELRVQAESLAAELSPIDALAEWLRCHMAFGRRGRGLSASVMDAKLQEGSVVNTACAAMSAAGERLLARAVDAGQVRPDVQLYDLLKMTHGIILVTEGAPDGEERAERMVDLVVAGMRTAPPA